MGFVYGDGDARPAWLVAMDLRIGICDLFCEEDLRDPLPSDLLEIIGEQACGRHYDEVMARLDAQTKPMEKQGRVASRGSKPAAMGDKPRAFDRSLPHTV
jgi:hypothetical protein